MASAPLTAWAHGQPPFLGLLFDVDGTLVDSAHLGFTATNKVLEQFGYPLIDTEEYHRGTRYTTPVRMAWHARLADSPEADLAGAAALGSDMGRAFDETYVPLVTPETAKLFDGLGDLLAELGRERIPMGVLSNAALAYVQAVITANQLRGLVSAQHGANSVRAPKPAPDGLLQCCEEMGGLDAARVVYVGDSPSDGKAARAAGMMCVGVTWGSNPRESLEAFFDIVVDTVDELKTALLAGFRARPAVAKPDGS